MSWNVGLHNIEACQDKVSFSTLFLRYKYKYGFNVHNVNCGAVVLLKV